MTQRSRLHQTNATDSKPKGLTVDSHFLSSLLIDDLIDTRNSIGSLHPSVWESLLKDTHGTLNHPARKVISTKSRKNFKNASTSDEERPKRETTSSRSQTKNVVLNAKKKITTVDFLTSDDEETPKNRAAPKTSRSSKNNVSNVRKKIAINDLPTSDDEGKPEHGDTLRRSKGTKNFVSSIRRKTIINDLLTSDDEEKPKHNVASNRTKNMETVRFNIRRKSTTDDFLITSDEEPLEYKTTLNKTKSTKNSVPNVRNKITTDDLPRSRNEKKLNEIKGTKIVLSDVRKKITDNEPPVTTEIKNNSSSKTINNETKSRKGLTYKSGKPAVARDFKDLVAKSTLDRRYEVLPTRKLRSSHKDLKPVRGRRSISDFSIENIDWYYENENYYRSECSGIISDYAVPEDGRIKSNAYTYLLLDSRRCKNRRNIGWLDFISAIFYIGKGTGDRAFQHAKDTEKWLTNKKGGTSKKDKKFQKIEEIWASRNPIKVFKITENITDNEAFTREAAMIDAMGLRRLCNKVSGHYQLGRAVMLKAIERCELGATLLVEAWNIFKGKETHVEDVKPKKKEIFDLYFECSDDEEDLWFGYN